MVVLAKNRVIGAGVDEVWDVLTDSENERKYWTNVRDVKVLSSVGNLTEREATVGPSGFRQKTKQTLVLDPKRSIKLSISGETIAGERVIMVSPLGRKETKVEVVWSLHLQGVPGFVDGIVKGQISKITEEALKKTAEAAEHAAEGRDRLKESSP